MVSPKDVGFEFFVVLFELREHFLFGIKVLLEQRLLNFSFGRGGFQSLDVLLQFCVNAGYTIAFLHHFLKLAVSRFVKLLISLSSLSIITPTSPPFFMFFFQFFHGGFRSAISGLGIRSIKAVEGVAFSTKYSSFSSSEDVPVDSSVGTADFTGSAASADFTGCCFALIADALGRCD